jgi:uncharacterized membrane protein HdeD (DUF308 family)
MEMKGTGWVWALGFGLFLILAGALVVFHAVNERLTLPLRFGLLCLIVALVHGVLGVMLRRYHALGRHLLLAVLYGLIGAFFLMFPAALPVVFVLVIGYAFVFIGMLRTGAAVVRRGLPGRVWLFPAGLLTIGAGIMVLLAWPSSALWLVRLLIGIELLVSGVATVGFAILLRRESRSRSARDAVPRPNAWARLAGLVVVTLVFLAGVWLSVMPVTHRYVHRIFAEFPRLEASFGSIELDLRQRVITMHEFRMRVTGTAAANSFTIDRIIMRPAITSVFDGEIIGSVALIRPSVKITRAAPEQRLSAEEVGGAIERLRRIVPFRIDRLDVRNARVDLKEAMPQLDMKLRDFNVIGRNLANSAGMRESLYATYEFEGKAMGAEMEGELRANLIPQKPVMHVKAEIRDLSIAQINDYLKSEYKVKAERGKLTAFTEVSVNGAQLDGYARTLFKDLELSPWPPPKKARGLLGKLRQGLAGLGGKIGVGVLAARQGTLASETPIRGELGSPELDLLSATGSTLRHAFGRALDANFRSEPRG